MKVIFLDIDGVLNCRYTKDRLLGPDGKPGMFIGIDVKMVDRLNRAIEATGAKVVVSSSWRTQYSIGELSKLLSSYGFVGEIIDYTPHGLEGLDTRGKEIDHWLTKNLYDVDKFIVLDDDTDIKPVSRYWLQTSYEKGLTEKHVPKIIKMLS